MVRVRVAASLVSEVSGIPHFPFFKKNIVELRHALAPDGFEVVEELASALEPRVVGGHQLLAAGVHVSE